MKREWVKDVVAVLLFLILFPYFAMSFVRQKDGEAGNGPNDMYRALLEASEETGYVVVWKQDGLETKMPMEIFLFGALAGSIKVEYEPEALEAQAVVLRSTLCQKYESEQTRTIVVEDEKSSYQTTEQLQKQWKEKYNTYNEKCLQAVINTQGVVMRWKGKAVNGCYHGMSAGRTRPGSELSTEGEFDYIREVDCQLNVGASDYEQKKSVSKEKAGELKEKEMSQNGYVISLYQDGKLIAGEQLRETLGLSSSNFTWKEEKGEYIFTTKGIGHGFGYDQFYGNELAKKGQNYQDILNYFFADITFEKMQSE